VGRAETAATVIGAVAVTAAAVTIVARAGIAAAVTTVGLAETVARAASARAAKRDRLPNSLLRS